MCTSRSRRAPRPAGFSDSGKALAASGHSSVLFDRSVLLDVTAFPYLSPAALMARDLVLTSPRQ